jgi:hypothetical protein
MLRDFVSALILAAVTGALYVLGMYLGPLHWKLGDDAWDLLVLVGLMLSAVAFFAEFIGSRLSRRLREDMAATDERYRRLKDATRERASRLNTYAPAPVGCTTATDTAIVAAETDKVIPFPARRGHLLRPIAH